MHKTLFIVAAGLSTRFNGMPKHLAQVKGESIILNTLKMAKKHYRDIWVVLNQQADKDIVGITRGLADAVGANVVLIPSGKGDADAVYRAVCKVEDCPANVSICWGDAWFKDGTVFAKAAEELEDDTSNEVFRAFCAMEESPYGWFDLEADGKTIIKASFASSTLLPSQSKMQVHDQCFFNINVKNFKKLFEAYEKSILAKKQSIEHGILADFASNFKLKINYEVSWYMMVNWCLARYTNDIDLVSKRSTVHMLEKPAAMAFNTEEELMEIEKDA